MKLALISCLLAFASMAQAKQNIVIIFDESGSMGESMGNESKMTAAKRGLSHVVGNMPNDSNVGLLLLTHNWAVPFGPLNKDQTIQAIHRVTPEGGTPLGGAMKTGADALLSSRKKDPYGSYRLLIVTDGEATDGDLVNKYTPDIVRRGITLDVIGVKMDSKHQLAEKAKTYRNVADAESLVKALQAALAETIPNPNSKESDFDLIAPLPSGFASAVLLTFSQGQSENQPIGEKPIKFVMMADNGQPVVTETPPAAIAASVTPAEGGIGFWSILLIICGGLALVIVVVVVVKGFKNCY